MADGTVKDQVELAKTVIEATLPVVSDREIVLRQLVRSVELANSVAPLAWAVTLFSDGFRLNVGQVEVLVFAANLLRVNLSGEAGTEPFVGPNYVGTEYLSMPHPQCSFVGNVSQYMRAAERLGQGHAKFIVTAATTRAGVSRAGTPFKRSHSEGLVQYAQDFVASLGDNISEISDWIPQEEIPAGTPILEGAARLVQVNAYERSSWARKRCLSHYGMKCMVCGFNFEATYGPTAKDYIQVHHLVPLAAIAKEYAIDPVRDLRPVCANCHAVIHLRTPPFSIEDVAAMLVPSCLDQHDDAAQSGSNAA